MSVTLPIFKYEINSYDLLIIFPILFLIDSIIIQYSLLYCAYT